MRDRQIPGSVPRLLALLDSAHEKTRAAAREALRDLSFENFLARFDSLSDEVQRSMGPLVSRVDLKAVPLLRAQLSADPRSRRLKAIEMAEAMDLTAQISAALIERLHDEDHLVRASAASALKGCNRTDVRTALQESLWDQCMAVQNAARASLANMPPLAPMPPLSGNYPMEMME